MQYFKLSLMEVVKFIITVWLALEKQFDIGKCQMYQRCLRLGWKIFTQQVITVLKK